MPVLVYVVRINPFNDVAVGHVIFALTPSWLLFLSTFGCKPYDSCSLTVLAEVVALNAVFYGVIGTCLAYSIGRARARLVLLAALLALEFVWLRWLFY